MGLSAEQKRKIDERISWLRHDEEFTTAAHIHCERTLEFVKFAFERIEEEKLGITGKGRYQEQCSDLVKNADQFFEHYDRELKQIGLSVFRFLHRVLVDHLGEEDGMRTYLLSQARVMAATHALFDAIRLSVVGGQK